MSARGGVSSAPPFLAGSSSGDWSGGSSPGYRALERDRRMAAAVESWTLTADQVERWLKSARVGEQLVYAHGPNLIDGAAAALVRNLGRDGVLHPFQRPHADGGRDYLARLNRVRVIAQRAPLCDANMLSVLVVLQDAAQNKARCPSDAAIAADTGLTSDQVKWQLKKLESAKLIERRMVATRADAKFRVVRIVATGAETTGPVNAAGAAGLVCGAAAAAPRIKR